MNKIYTKLFCKIHAMINMDFEVVGVNSIFFPEFFSGRYFKCPQCDYKFNNQSNLDVHTIQMHMNQDPLGML